MSVPIEIIAVIKELEIFGFKSFAAKTKVPFRHRITAVVGPNGCGKSNILDAMKWVLGEKSVKAIRGEKMEDVIFSGTETKKPANFAEVAVTLDNQNRLLDLEMDEVKIGRRLFRDGQSQYYLNDRKVARKDIEHLLFDTGVGKSSYSFMEQGRMDMILSSKPEERRAVFEEAAGISRYKAKKEEAERNLENARLNMTRLQDILRELERELKIKESQAEKTRQYNDLLSSRKDHDLRIRFFTLQEINTSLVDLDQKLEKKRAEAEKLRQKNLQVRERLEQIDEEKSVKTTELHQKDTGNQVARERIAQWEKRIEETSRRIVEQTGQAESMRSQLAKVEKRVKELRDDRSRQDQMTLQLNARLEDAQRALKEIDTNSEKLKKDIADAEKRQKENRQQLADNREKILEQRSELEAVIQDLLRSLKEEKKNWEKAEKVSSGEAERIIKVLNEIGEHLASESADSAQKISAVQKLFNQLNHTSAIEKIAALPASLRHLLFEEGGIHSRKEQLDEQIIALEDTNRKLDRELEEIQNLTLELRERLAASMRQKETISGDIRSFNVQVDNLKEKDRTLKEQIGFEEASLQFHREQFRAIDKEIVQANTDLKGMQNEIAKLQAGIQKEIERIAALEKALAKLDQKRHDLLASVQDENRKAEEIQEAMNELEIRIGTLIGSREVITQDIYNDFNLTLDEVAEKLGKDKIQLAGEKNKLGDIQKQIEALGPINALAIEELKTVQELHKHNNTQLQDILKARDDILSVIADIQSQSESMFLESFAQIENNFREVFRTLFKGGDTKLTLTEPDNPLESGIDISVKPPGKSAKSLRLLSGG
ncbi:MAG: AAA family ATPase, partial [Leptospiraceae bacterium]|nr:AAA family ATPase [Leptospiraceae bacterium]